MVTSSLILFFERLLDDFKGKRHLTETWMLSQRYKEEVILIASEMNTFVRSLDSTIHSLRRQLAEPLSEPVRLMNHCLFVTLI